MASPTTTDAGNLALELRVRSLEAQVYGVPASIIGPSGDASGSTSTSASANAPGPSTSRTPQTTRLSPNPAAGNGAGSAAEASSRDKSVIRRVQDLNEALDRVFSESDALKLLYTNYERYLPLLKGGDEIREPRDTKDKTASPADPSRENGHVRVSDLVPEAAKLAIVLEAAEDIRSAERALREIELLRARGADSAGELEQIVPLRTNLVHGLERQREETAKVDQLRSDVTALVRNYDHFTNAASEVFMALHHRLEALEDAASFMERAERKRLAERY